ncbi:MAG: FGGY-family carbohydrate kinase [Kiritimatiellia bacterium]
MDPRARGLIIGWPRLHRLHLVRAALEGMAFQVRDVIDAMAATSEVPLELLRAGGGAAAGRALMQLQADLLGVRSRSPAASRRPPWGPVCWPASPPGFIRRAALRLPPPRPRGINPPCPETRSALHARWRSKSPAAGTGRPDPLAADEDDLSELMNSGKEGWFYEEGWKAGKWGGMTLLKPLQR